MSKLPSLVSAILYRDVQGSNYSKKCQDFAVMSDIIRGPKAKKRK